MKSVNKAIRKKDAMELLLGKPVYTDDIAPKDCLVVKLLRSPYANAFVKNINPTISLCIEIIPNCLNNLMKKIPQGYTAKIRLSQSVASFAHSPLGNLLIDIYPNNSWSDIEQLNDFLLKQNGVISSSYFKNLVTSIITENNNEAIEIKKG